MIWVVAAREYRERIRSRAFVLATVFTVLLFAAVLVIPQLTAGSGAATRIGYLAAAETLAVTAERIDAVAAAQDDGIAGIELVEVSDRAVGELALGRGDIDVLLIDTTSAVVERPTPFAGASVPGVVNQAARVLELESLVSETDLTNEDIAAVLGAGTIDVEALRGSEVAESRTVVAYAGMMLTYVALLMYGTWTLLGVTEEKSSRVVEIIVSAIRPTTLLAGKVLGIGLVAITQLVVMLVAVAAVLYATGTLSTEPAGDLSLSPEEIPIESVGMLVLWFVVGFSLYNVLFAAVGSLVSRMEDAQNANMPLVLGVVGSLVLSVSALADPTGTAAVVGTFVPFSAPFVVPVRHALEAIDPWETVVSLAIVAVTLLVAIRVAGRIYEGAILRTGGKVRLREAWRGDR